MINEARKNLRIKENFGVAWRLKDTRTGGQGRILNMSASGLLMETENPVFPDETSGVFQLDSFLHGPDNFLPHEGRLVWSQKKNRNRILCGVEFTNVNDTVLTKLRERIQTRIMKQTRRRKLQGVAGVALGSVMIGLVIFLTNQQAAIYQSLQNSHQMITDSFNQQASLTRNYANLYQETQQMLASVREELDTTRTVLKETEALLVEAKDKNTELQNQLAALAAQEVRVSEGHNELEKEIALLHDKNAEFADQLSQLKSQMRAFEGDIRNIEEGKAVMALFKNRLKLVKTKIHYLKREAYYARQAAQKERDRILFLQGNQGYIVKNTESPLKPVEQKASGEDKKQVEIDVSFIE